MGWPDRLRNGELVPEFLGSERLDRALEVRSRSLWKGNVGRDAVRVLCAAVSHSRTSRNVDSASLSVGFLRKSAGLETHLLEAHVGWRRRSAPLSFAGCWEEGRKQRG